MSDEPLPTTAVPPPGLAPVPPSPWSALPSAAAQVTAGSLMARTFQVWWRHLLPFSLMSFVAAGPALAGFAVAGFPLSVLSGGRVPPEELQALGAAFFRPAALVPIALGVLGSGLLFLAQYGGVMHGAERHLSGGAAGVAEMWREGFRRLWATFATSVLFGLLVWLGLVLLVVPGVMAGAAFSVAVPAAVLERRGAVAALRRSATLTKGRRLALLAAFVVVVAVSTGLRLGANLLTLAAPLAGTILGVAMSALTGSLTAVLPAVAFHDLRSAKEGLNPAALVRVFE